MSEYMTEEQFDATYGESDWNINEDQARNALASSRLWSHVEGDDGDYLLAGYHPVNLIQFVRTARAWQGPAISLPPVGPLRG